MYGNQDTVSKSIGTRDRSRFDFETYLYKLKVLLTIDKVDI